MQNVKQKVVYNKSKELMEKIAAIIGCIFAVLYFIVIIGELVGSIQYSPYFVLLALLLPIPSFYFVCCWKLIKTPLLHDNKIVDLNKTRIAFILLSLFLVVWISLILELIAINKKDYFVYQSDKLVGEGYFFSKSLTTFDITETK